MSRTARSLVCLSLSAIALGAPCPGSLAGERGAIAAGVAGGVAGAIAGDALSTALQPQGPYAVPFPPPRRCWTELRQERLDFYSYHYGQAHVCE